MMPWGYNYGMGFGWIFMVLFWVLLILGIIYLIKVLAGGSSSGSKEKPESAEEMLRKRFARGEINREEMEEALAVLKKHRE